MRIERELMRGVGPVAVLKILESGAKYGYELTEELSQTTQGVLEMGQSTLYPLLYNLEAQGMLKSEWETAPSGRRRRYYSLTAKGKKRLTKEAEQWKAAASVMLALGVFTSPAPLRPAVEGGNA